jgi:disulfide oxidoreductase YuzD
MSKKADKKYNRQHDAKLLVIRRTIDEFRNKSGAWQSQDKAEKLKSELKNLLTEDEYWKMVIAHSHYVIGEGEQELYDVCKELMDKYGV